MQQKNRILPWCKVWEFTIYRNKASIFFGAFVQFIYQPAFFKLKGGIFKCNGTIFKYKGATNLLYTAIFKVKGGIFKC